MTIKKPACTSSRSDVLLYSFLLTLFFLLLEISFFIQSNQAYLFHFDFIASHLVLPWAAYPAITFFICIQLALHVLFTLLVWQFTETLITTFTRAKQHVMLTLVVVWLVMLLTLFASNQTYFPNSKFAELTSIIFPSLLAKYLAYIGMVIMIGIFLISLFNNRKIQIMAILVVLMVTLHGATIWLTPHPHDASLATKPNIIIVGIDSLRPDSLSFFGSSVDTPFLDSLLVKSTVFSEAVTPLARTFPSWNGILLGLYPKESGIRSNLVKREHFDYKQSLPMLLKQQGYETFFATDETRFSNVDQAYGFDHIISPPMGLNDFLLGSFNDFPISNLIINTWAGRILFPYSYANRPVYFTYQPQSFLALIGEHIHSHQAKPLFLAVHFCLPHHPYLWSLYTGEGMSALERYHHSVVRVDQQLRDFWVLLEHEQLLNHAIVIILSDHGEALELAGDRITEAESYYGRHQQSIPPKFYPASLDKESVNQSVGHGTDVLGLPQYHALLAFRLYGMHSQASKIVPGLVTLLDIKPTLLDLITTRTDTRYSLKPYIVGRLPRVNDTKRHVFLESDFSPNAIRTVYPETRQVILEGMEIFQIDPNSAMLSVKKEMLHKIIKSKQVADIYQQWMLALYPQDTTHRTAILINLHSGAWTDDLHSKLAQDAPLNEMMNALHTFYGDELT